MPYGTTFKFVPHEISFSADERRIYAGVIASTRADLNQGIKLLPPSKEELGPEGGFNFLWAGLRVVDLKDPRHPVEVADFKHGDACGGHVRYLPVNAQIWLSCGQSGFLRARTRIVSSRQRWFVFGAQALTIRHNGSFRF